MTMWTTPMARACVAWGCGLTLAGSPFSIATAMAPQAAPSSNEANDLADDALVAFEEKRFNAAARLFLDAYQLNPRPTLLWNAARAHEMAGNLEEAVKLLRQYMTVADPAGQQRAQERLTELQSQLTPAPPVPQVVKSTRNTHVPAIAALSTSAALLVTSGILFGLATSHENDLEKSLSIQDDTGKVIGITQRDVVDRNDSIAAEKTAALVVGSLGVATAAVGWVLWVRNHDADRARLAWLPQPTLQGLAWGGAF